jgi:PAT family beta-lactamase induction signal transducer AmpG
MAPEKSTKFTWGQAFAVYAERPVLSMLFLGFSAGLPFYLVFQTLTAWLRLAHVDRAQISMLGWVGLMYTFKWMWAPIVDRVSLPLLGAWLGRRRSWILLAQVGVAVCLFGTSLGDPAKSISYIAILAVTTAFFAATQDIAIDAWRIESTVADKQGAMAAAYQGGYRVALVVGQAGVFFIAADYGWHIGYLSMAALMGACMLVTILVREPAGETSEAAELRERRAVAWLAARAHWPPWLRNTGAFFVGAFVGPVADFFGRYGLALGLLIFAFIGSYRLTDFAMGTMTNPFYIDVGFTLKEIAAVIKVFGLVSSLLGVFIGGLIVARFGRIGALFIGSLLIIVSNVNYSLFAAHGCHIPLDCAQSGWFDFIQGYFTARGPASTAGIAAIVSFDNIAIGVHGTALIAFLSSLTSSKYTATQYAVLSSLYALPGKLLMGTSGFVVNALGYGDFFLYTALLSVIGLLLLVALSRRDITAARD